jgi:bis(5'-nucleosyl)-tetraphosphatase (symmetrical)
MNRPCACIDPAARAVEASPPDPCVSQSTRSPAPCSPGDGTARFRHNTRVATYAIGDVQGCARSLDKLVEQLCFDAARDRLWFVGDLVNRGPASLEVLRFVRGLGDAAMVVLGNHDLHLLARAAGVRPAEPGDTLDAVLAAPDRELLLDWLLHRPLIHLEDRLVLVHAGLASAWSVATAERLAREAEAALRTQPVATLKLLRGKGEHRWRDDLQGADRLRFILRALTRLRLCDADGGIAAGHKGPPETAPSGAIPWFDVAGRASSAATVVCGHWAALGLRLRDDLVALDSACVWGGCLSAVRLEDRAVFQQPCANGC